MVVVESAGLTDVGRKRKGNEDALLLNDEMQVYVVADGMGGHQAGEVASSLVVNTMQDYLKRFKEGSENVEELIDTDQELSKDANRLISSIQLSNRVVYQVSNSKASYRGMGSTVSAVCFTEETLIAANVGDSPIYLMRKGKVETLSVPHTVIAEQMALNPEGGKNLGKKFNHMLTRAMGIERTVKSDSCEIPCFKDDILVLCSDGLSDKLSPTEVLDVTKNRKMPSQKICQMLVDMANERGGDDNITVIVLKVKSVAHKKGGIKNMISRLFNKY